MTLHHVEWYLTPAERTRVEAELARSVSACCRAHVQVVPAVMDDAFADHVYECVRCRNVLGAFTLGPLRDSAEALIRVEPAGEEAWE